MTSTHPNPVEQAQQGDPKAIAFLVNRQLAAKRYKAAVSKSGRTLLVVLEGEKVPDRGVMVPWLRSALRKLGAAGIDRLELSDRKTGSPTPT